MKKLYKLFGIIAIGAVIGLFLGACDLIGGGCKGDGACYYIESNGDHKWCGDQKCNVWTGGPGQKGTLSCDC